MKWREGVGNFRKPRRAQWEFHTFVVTPLVVKCGGGLCEAVNWAITEFCVAGW